MEYIKSKLKNIIVMILILEAKRILKRYKPKVVAVTGSVGKTGTKDAIYTALSKTEHARKSEKSFNSEIGVPLTVLGLPNAWSSFVGWIENIGEGFILPWRGEKYPDWLVLEIGVDRPGDIKRFSWIQPDIVVFTRFPDVPVHVEYFSSPDDVINEKRELKKALKEDGALIINADDEKMLHEKAPGNCNKISYGFSEFATVRAHDYAVEYEDGKPAGIKFNVRFQEEMIGINLKGVLGMHHVYPVLSALAVLVVEGKSFAGASKYFDEYLPAPGRMRVLHGIKGSTLIDDTYNSSPTAVEAGMKTLASLETKGKKIVVLGDMLELGDFSVKEHQNVGRLVATTADVFIAVGVRMLTASEEALSAKAKCKRVESFQTGEEALHVVRGVISEGDIVFVKGSQGMRLEKMMEHLLLDPQEAVKVLPRQDTHWKKIK